ncbi:MAG: 50S ribosomal protein L18Ae [Candidatus Thermoplasmatota archaeon]|nr:50S ribosomal protein L18Ae [Candidatus Thermoplasmatota archaeon]
MKKKAYRVEGKFYMKNTWQPFKKEIASSSKAKAKEKIVSIIGSNHRAKRKMIKIEEVKELSPDEVENLVVQYLIGH